MKKRAVLFIGLVLFVMLYVGSAQAYNPDHLKQLLETGHCPEGNLSRANLEGANLE